MYTLQTMLLKWDYDVSSIMMKTLAQKTKPMSMPLIVLALIVVVTITPHAFATTFTDANNPHGPLEPIAWAAAFAVIGVLSE